MRSKSVEENGVTITATEMIAGRKSRNVANVKILGSTNDMMYTEYQYTYVKKFHTRITQINKLIKCVQ